MCHSIDEWSFFQPFSYTKLNVHQKGIKDLKREEMSKHDDMTCMKYLCAIFSVDGIIAEVILKVLDRQDM